MCSAVLKKLLLFAGAMSEKNVVMSAQEDRLTDDLAIIHIGDNARLWKRFTNGCKRYIYIPLGLLMEVTEFKDRILPGTPWQYSKDDGWIVMMSKNGWYGFIHMNRVGEVERYMNFTRFQLSKITGWITDNNFIPPF